MTKILLVDDDEPIRTVLSAYLEAENYTLYVAQDGQNGLDQFRRYKPDIVILDIMLPKVDGLEVLQQIRRESEAYVILLTAKSEEMDRIIGLTIGADDYITKPFSPRELVARIKAFLRRKRKGALDSHYLHFGHIRIDDEAHQVFRDDQEIELTPLEFQLLKTLALHAGHVLSREQLLEQVWGYNFYGEIRLVDVHIGHIRQKLEVDANDPRFIVTIRGIGYKFEDDTP